MSPLMLAAQQEDIACVRLLLTHNADVHARDSDGDNGNLRESERAFRARACVCAGALLAICLLPSCASGGAQLVLIKDCY